MVLEKAAHVSDLFRGSNRSVGSPQKNYRDSDCEHHLLNNLSRWGLVLKHTQKKERIVSVFTHLVMCVNKNSVDA